METSSAVTLNRIQPLRALKAMSALMRNPDDTAQVFTIVEALSGRAHEQLRRRFAADATGARLLRERPDLVERLADRQWLRTLPEGSLGCAYLQFVESEGISAEGLVDASRRGAERTDPPELEYVRSRMRDTHDLWHAVTGYLGDTLGETALLAFLAAQTANPGIVLILLMALVRLPSPEGRQLEGRKLILEGFRRGRRAVWMPPIEWEAWLALPLEEVRRRLRIEQPPRYAPVRTSDLRARGLLA